MEELRIREKNIVNIRLRELNNYIKKNEETIKRLSSQASSEYNITQINKLETKNIEYKKELETLNEKLNNISSGNMDKELSSIAEVNQNVISKKCEDKIKKKTDEKAERKVKEAKNLKISYDMNRYRQNNEATEWEMNKEYNRFLKICDTIPDYINRNLKEMPSNKGYIFRGIWCFGEKPAEPGQPLIMFERLKNDIMRIYEIDHEYRKIFEKQGKHGKRVLISKEKRCNILKK